MRTCLHGSMRARAVVLLVVLGIGLPARGAIPCAWCATEFTQVLNNIELLGVNATQAQALATQFRQLEIQIKKARRLEPQQVLGVATAFGELVRIVQTARGVSVHAADVDSRYLEEFGGFDRYASAGAGSMASRYRQWSDASHENIRAALRAAGLHAAQFYDEQVTLRALERQAVGADGMLRVAQAAAQIAALQVEEGRKLRAMLAAQVQMQANVAAVETERGAAADADLDKWKRETREAMPEEAVGIEGALRR